MFDTASCGFVLATPDIAGLFEHPNGDGRRFCNAYTIVVMVIGDSPSNNVGLCAMHVQPWLALRGLTMDDALGIGRNRK